MNYSYVSQADSLQLEISTKCNALCPGCVRTDHITYKHARNVFPKNQELSRTEIGKVLSSSWANRLTKLEFCGTMDEPLAHSDFLGILDDIYKTHPGITVYIHTNGSLRNEDYFVELAQKMSRFSLESAVRFSIDGIGPVHSVYRYNTDFDKIIKNLKAFTRHGGRAIWQTLLFPWNTHQVDEMRAMAKEIGCVSFFLRPDRSSVSQMGEEKLRELRSQNLEPYDGLPKGTLDIVSVVEPLMPHSVSCIYRDERKMIFISWDGNVWPCCFWTNLRYENKKKADWLNKNVYQKYGEQFNSLKDHSFDDILQHPFFTYDLVKSWESGSILKARCAEKCSSRKMRTSDGQVDDKKHLEQVSF